MQNLYIKSSKYTDYEQIYSLCAGPGGIKATEFIADKMNLKQGSRLLDIGTFYGVQTCFLAKEYGVFAIGIDPGARDWDDGMPFVDLLMDTANMFGVHDKVLGFKSGVPNTLLPENSFDYACCTTTLEMLRGMYGREMYFECLKEIYRVLKPGGIFGLGEPMRRAIEIPVDLLPFVSDEWKACLATIDETKSAMIDAGFTVNEAEYAHDSQLLWNEYAKYNKFHNNEYEDKKLIELNDNRWLSYGYVIAEKRCVT